VPPLRVARFGDAPVDWITDVGGFRRERVLDLHPGFPRYTRPAEHTRGVEFLRLAEPLALSIANVSSSCCA